LLQEGAQFFSGDEEHQRRLSCDGPDTCKCPEPKCIVRGRIYAFNKLSLDALPAINKLHDHGTIHYELELRALQSFTMDRRLFKNYEEHPYKHQTMIKRESGEMRKWELRCIEHYKFLHFVEKERAEKCGFKLHEPTDLMLYSIFNDGNWQTVQDIFAFSTSGWCKAVRSGEAPTTTPRRLCYNNNCIKREHMYAPTDEEYKKRCYCPGTKLCECPIPKCIVGGPLAYGIGWLTQRSDRKKSKK
jgi:hypothetical protein